MILGIDVSKWQKEMDWSVAWAAGANYAFIRAGSISTSGVPYTDYQFETNAKIAPDYMPVGFYWYMRPQFDPAAQAEYFCNLIKDKKFSMPPVLDLEDTGGLSAAEITEAAKIFIIEVFVRLDVWCLLYSRGLWLNDNTIDDEIWDFVELWAARYKDDLTGPWSDGYAKPDNFDNWRFWQKSAGGNGRGAEFGAKSASIDIDYFNGDQEAFDAYVGAPPVVAEQIRVTYWRGSVLRDIPDGEFVTIAKPGEVLQVQDEGIDGSGKEWWQVASGLWIPKSQVEIL